MGLNLVIIWYVGSLIVHFILMAGLYYIPSVNKTEPIEITVKVIYTIPIKIPKTTQKAAKGPNRLSNDGNNNLDLTDRLTAENYIERLKALIEPQWRQQVATRYSYLKRAKRPLPSCTTCLAVNVLSNGYTQDISVLTRCHDAHFDTYAIEAFNRTLPPPPKSLIENNMLAIDWCFRIK